MEKAILKKNEYMCITESFCCAAEIDIISQHTLKDKTML